MCERTMAFTVVLLMAVTANATPEWELNAEKYLLLDTRVIQRIENARLALGQVEKAPQNPLFGEDRVWEPRFDNLYANVIYNPERGLYQCWYSPFIIDELASETPRSERDRVPYRPKFREMGICYAFSKDGLRWEKPELGLIDFQGSKRNNLVIRGPHGAGVMRDEWERDPARRFKMFARGEKHVEVAFSPDGLRWTKPIAAPEIQAPADTHNNAFWSPHLEHYVGITRLFDRTLNPALRLVGRVESGDFTHWTKATEVFRALPTETTRQLYAMPVFQYAGIYLGLAMFIDTKTDTVDCELTWSPDTLTWSRVCPGQPLIPRGEAGAYDSHCIYAAAYPVIETDEIKLYYGGNNGKHFGWRDGFFCLARLRPDGFAGYEAIDAEEPARVVIRSVRCVGRRLVLSADAAGGTIRVGILGRSGYELSKCKPIEMNGTDCEVVWNGDSDLTSLHGENIRLVFEIEKARLYAFGFSD